MKEPFNEDMLEKTFREKKLIYGQSVFVCRFCDIGCGINLCRLIINHGEDYLPTKCPWGIEMNGEWEDVTMQEIREKEKRKRKRKKKCV